MRGARLRVCVVTDAFPTLSETFIRRQVEHLGADVAALKINSMHSFERSTERQVVSLLDGSLISRMGTKVADRARRFIRMPRPPASWPRNARANWRRYLSVHCPDVVLAQYGLNGVRCLSGCQRFQIPLVVQFLGYDASVSLNIPSYRRRLPELFEKSSAVVALSRDMGDRLMRAGCPANRL